MLAWLDEYYGAQSDPIPDYRTDFVVTFDETTGAPQLSGWPVAFDLSYSNEYLQTAGSDGLPIGDLNWFPTAKATYDANRTEYVAALKDSVSNAKVKHVAGNERSPFITPEDVVGVESEVGTTPNEFYLESNYPNPFNPTTTIKFGLPEQAKVTLSVFNILGQKVYELTEKSLSAGSHSINFDASSLSSGIYIYNINAVGANGQNYTSSKKMTLLK